MTLTEMQSYLAAIVDDPQQTYFTPAQTLIFINQAQSETQKLLINAGQNYFFKQHTFNTVINQANYSLPADFLKLNQLVYNQGTAPNNFITNLSSITMNQALNFSLYAQYPTNFYFKTNEVVLVPIPQTVCEMIMTYTYRLPNLVTGTDVSEIPLEFHDYIVWKAALQCFVKDQRDPSSVLEYTRKVEEDLKRAAVERAQDRAPTIVRTENGSGGWGGWGFS